MRRILLGLAVSGAALLVNAQRALCDVTITGMDTDTILEDGLNQVSPKLIGFMTATVLIGLVYAAFKFARRKTTGIGSKG